MDYVELTWLHDEGSLKEALQSMLQSSGQILKKHFSSKQLTRAVKAREVSRLPLDLVNQLRINPTYEGPEIEILAETETYLAIHKPPAIHSHPHLYSDKNTVLNFLVSRGMWKPLGINIENYDRGLFYRLDYETSGVLILAKNEKLLKHVREEFATEMKRKFYWAIVNGSFDREGLHTHYFKGSGARGSKQKVQDEVGEELKAGSLAVMKIAESQGKSLVLVNLKTGLRHQIRAQLAHLGFPIHGDELYGGGQGERLFLHAFRYEWVDIIEDPRPELFHIFFDLNSALKMSHDVLGRF